MPQRLQHLSLEAALAEADKEQGDGRVRARCLAERLAPRGQLWVSRFDQAEFLSVAWQEDDNTRYLTSSAPRRTLRTVAERILSEFASFGALVAAEARPGELDPAWFRTCADIALEFDWAKWTKPWFVPASANEIRKSPETILYVCEGVHRTIVAAVMLLNGSVEWSPMLAIEAGERLAECC